MRKSIGALCIFFLLASSCVLHKRYVRPCIDAPESWRLPTDESSVIANIAWWDRFNDCVLNGLIQEALENNYDLRTAIASVQQYWAQYKEVRSQLFPQITGSGSDSRQEASLASLTPFPVPGLKRTTNLYSLYLNLSFEIDVWGKLVSETEAALAEYYAQIETRRTVVLTLVGAVASGYIDLRLFDKQLEIAKKTQEAYKEKYDLVNERFLGGLISEMEVKQQQALLDGAIIQVHELEIQQQQQENLLCVLLGRNPGPIQRGLSIDQLILPLDVPAGLPSQIVEQRPDIINAEEQLVAANANIGVAMADAFPQFSLTGLYGNSSLELHNLLTGFARTWQIGTSFLQSIYTGGRITAQIEQADAQYVEALNQYYQVVLSAFAEVDNALIGLQKSKEILIANKDQVQALMDYLELAELQYDNGQTDYLNVVDAQRDLFASELDYAQAEANCFLFIINLYKSLGGGWVLDADRTAVESPFSH